MFLRKKNVALLYGFLFSVCLFFLMNGEDKKVEKQESFLVEPTVKSGKKQKRNITKMRQDVAEELESLLHASSDLIAELAFSQKEFMEKLRRIAENEPALTRAELEDISARAQQVAEKVKNCKTTINRKK